MKANEESQRKKLRKAMHKAIFSWFPENQPVVFAIQPVVFAIQPVVFISS